jgi:hypothetical protein
VPAPVKGAPAAVNAAAAVSARQFRRTLTVTCLKEREHSQKPTKRKFHHMIPTREEQLEQKEQKEKNFVVMPRSTRKTESRMCTHVLQCANLAELQRSHVFVVIPPVGSAS